MNRIVLEPKLAVEKLLIYTIRPSNGLNTLFIREINEFEHAQCF